jgi:hypothetical protein
MVEEKTKYWMDKMPYRSYKHVFWFVIF